MTAEELEQRALENAQVSLNTTWQASVSELSSWIAKLSSTKRADVVTGTMHAALFAAWQLAMDYSDSKSPGSAARTAGRDIAASLEKLMKEVQ